MLIAAFDTLNFVSIGGLFAMLFIAWLLSSHKTKVNWKLVVLGLVLQVALAAVLFQSQNWTRFTRYDSFEKLVTDVVAGEVPLASADRAIKNEKTAFEFSDQTYDSFDRLREAVVSGGVNSDDVEQAVKMLPQGLQVPEFPNGILFYGVEEFFKAIERFVREGTGFVFSNNDSIIGTFAFGVLPTVIFFAALMSILYHIGLMQILIKGMAWVMQKTLGTSGAESMAAAANVLVGHTEAPLVIKPFVGNMTRSELNALMVGGFATITGSLMAIFVGMGVSAGHLLTASIISAPAALIIAKILQPETETPETLGEITGDIERPATNVIEAAAIGAADGMKLALNIAAMLIAFLALIAVLDWILNLSGELVEWLTNWVRDDEFHVDLNWSMRGLFGFVFQWLAMLMGIQQSDAVVAGELLGTKMVVNEFVSYLDFGKIIRGEITTTLADGTVEKVTLSERSQVILTYALAGFSNFGAIGIQIGGIGPLAPHRRSDLAQLGLRAMFGGMLACCMTACIAGVMYGVLR